MTIPQIVLVSGITCAVVAMFWLLLVGDYD